MSCAFTSFAVALLMMPPGLQSGSAAMQQQMLLLTAHDENPLWVGMVQQRWVHKHLVIELLICLRALHLAIEEQHLQGQSNPG
jgi:hypothetical protein